MDDGVIGTFGDTGKVVNITGTAGWIELRNINNASGVGLFNPQSSVNPTWSSVIRPFPLVTEGSRKAIKIPFCTQSSAFNVTISANSNPAGNSSYRRTKKIWVTQETGYNAGIVTNAYATTLGNSGLTTVFSPDIDYQLDINTVGAGAQRTLVTSGEIVISLPSSYDAVNFSISQEI